RQRLNISLAAKLCRYQKKLYICTRFEQYTVLQNKSEKLLSFLTVLGDFSPRLLNRFLTKNKYEIV
ncbi:MAG TPA: hypothetical protein VMI35_01675, partial [Puia sp.]|nr:hypothetical protein [Puia sp.]